MRHLKLTLELTIPHDHMSDATRTARVAFNLLRNVAARITGTLSIQVDGIDLPVDTYLHSREFPLPERTRREAM